MADFLMTTSAMPVYMIYPRFLMDMDLSETEKLVYVILRFFTESCGIDRNEVDKRSKEDF